MLEIAGVPLSILVLFAVLILIAVRQVGNVKLKIWQIMLFGAVIVFVTGEIAPDAALSSINADVMLFLFGMFIIGESLFQSGYLSHLSHRLFKRARNVDQMILLILFVFGFLSAVLMNDTLAIIGTPLMLYFAKKFEISSKLMLMTLAIAVTTGSVISPIGNPQNLLIALSGDVENPFVTFFVRLAVPTIINLFLAFLILRIFFRDEFSVDELNHYQEPIKDPKLAFLSKVSLLVVISLIILKVALFALSIQIDLRLTYIALIGAAPIVFFSGQRFRVVRNIDWPTLIFFASMFVLMGSVWSSGFFQASIGDTNILSIPMVLGVSVFMSQLVSNVPFVALYLPMLQFAGGSSNEMIALAAGSTIAGNLFIFGAASNVIIIQNAEKRGETLKFLEFAKIGIPLTIANVLVYWLFLSI
ncbi:MAG: SLC13 family permease [Thermoplasmata archaeon]|nr:SLC13 family permease [Thermoplasmata archaeon]